MIKYNTVWRGFGNGVETTYSPPALTDNISDIEVYIDDTKTEDWNWVDGKIEFFVAPPEGSVVAIYRVTNPEQLPEFTPNTPITAGTLNSLREITKKSLEEAYDGAMDSIEYYIDSKALKEAAEISAANAANSESNAAQSAANAANSASAALTSETQASQSASVAAQAYVNAHESEQAAETSEANAAQSAAEAADSAASASQSAISALNSKNSASQSATEAASSATFADNRATSASQSANAAALSETHAATSEINAATSEANAATSENNASVSESHAATSEYNASLSATSAANSASSAANSAQDSREYSELSGNYYNLVEGVSKQITLAEPYVDAGFLDDIFVDNIYDGRYAPVVTLDGTIDGGATATESYTETIECGGAFNG